MHKFTVHSRPHLTVHSRSVYNGAALVERALRSLLVQTFVDWEAILVDDGSTDHTPSILETWSNRDSRFRMVRLPENRGLSAARNAGLREARGKFIAYLDDDDEFYPDYLHRVAAMQDKADVLVFGFDMFYDDGPLTGQVEYWDPTQVRDEFFCFNPAVPLGMSHCRALVDKTGGFNELLWLQEDWDLWKRMSRAKARFAFCSAKSGIYHVRAGTLSRSPRLTAAQRDAVLANWRAGRPIFTPASNVDSGEPASAQRTTVRKIAFLSPHCLLDANKDAVRAGLNGLQLLANSGFECQAFCGTCFNAAEETLMEEVLARQRLRYEGRTMQVGPHRARMIFAADGNVGLTLFNTVSTGGRWRDDAEVAAFLTACDMFLARNHPDVVWAYGLDPVALEMQRLAMRLDIPIVLAVDNADYADDSVFQRADYAVVASERERQFHWQRIGLASLVLPPVADPACADRLAPVYREFFAGIAPQPGPPLVPREAGKA